MNEIRRKGKAEGSVLFTVVSVMMVMVVFLMSTLTLTTSANRRSYYTFYENQAQYTAQGVLDAISNNAFNDQNFYDWVKALPTTGGEITVGVTDSKIALTPGSEVRAFVEPVDDNYIWDQETGSVRRQSGWKITVTASVGRGKNASESTMVNYIFENYQNDVESDAHNTASWFVTDTLTYSESGGGGDPGSKSVSNLANAMFTGSGAGFYSANNLLCLGPQTFGITRFPAGRGQYSAQGTTNSFSNDSTTVGNGIFVGNFDANKIYFDFQSRGEGVQLYGNFKFLNEAIFSSDLSDWNQSGKTYKYRDTPYIYCDGDLDFSLNTQAQVGGDTTLSKKTQPVNIYTNSISALPISMMGDMYIFDPDADSYLESNQDTNLARFVGENVKKTNYGSTGYVAGDIFCNSAAVTLNGGKYIGGDLIYTNPNGVLTIDLSDRQNRKFGDLTIAGAIVCAGTLNINTSGKNLNVGGGIYATNINYTGASKVNNKDNPSLETICDNPVTREGDAYHDKDLKTITNSSTHATIESLGMKEFSVNTAEGEGYAQLVQKILSSGNPDDTFYGDGPDGSAYSGPDYSLFPFGSRQDEIFTQYLRWDLAAATQADAKANWENDPLCQESYACGHAWGEQVKYADDPTDSSKTLMTYVPYTTPVGVTTLDFVEQQKQTDHSFIPPLDTRTTKTDNSQIYTSGSAFMTKYNITDTVKMDSLTTQSVTIISRPAGGAFGEDAKVDLGDVGVITKNCVLDLETGSGGKTTIFVDPTKNGGNPLAIYLKGGCQNRFVTIVVNNSGYYSGGYGSTNVTGYAEKTIEDDKPYFAGRSDCLFFLDKDIYASEAFRIVTSGAYKQIDAREYDVISSPIYPGAMDSDGKLFVNGDWKAKFEDGDKDACKFEMIPNIVVYGEAGGEYNGYGGGAFPNGSMFNAEVIMPESWFKCPSGTDSVKAASMVYREYTDSVPYDSAASTGKMIVSLGTLYVKDLNVANIPLCVYLGDYNRPSAPGTPTIKRTGTGSAGDQSGNIMVGNNNDKFGKNYQGAS